MFIEEDYQKIFYSLSFNELKPIKKDIQNGYYISHGMIANKEVVIRILTKSDKTRVKNYKKELAVSKILKKGSPKEILSRFACTWEIGENDKFIWSIRDYVSGKAVSLYDRRKLLMGFDEIDPNLKKDEGLITAGIKENLKFLWSIDLSSENNIFRERFSREMDQKKIMSVESGIGFTLLKQIDFYKRNKDQIFSSGNIKASFGDLTPANIIYNNDKKVVFLDFEWFCLDNYLADVSFLWLYLWHYPAWQKKLLDSIIVTGIDQISFCVNLIRQIIGFYSEYVFNDNEIPCEGTYVKRNLFPKHKWTQYLKAACSYNELIKIK